MRKLMTMRAALESPDIFGKVFVGESWGKWRVLLIAAMGEELTTAERAVFQSLTGRAQEPLAPVDELWAIMGRRSGKTRAIAILGAYLASLCDFTEVLAPGERAILPILSASLWQAGKSFQYLDGVFASVPALRKLVTGQTSDTISLSTRVDIECRPASFRTIRSGTAIAVIADEAAFWRSDESTNPDTAILNAARPLLATTGGILVVISSPHAQAGEVFKTFKRDFGPDGDAAVLVAKASSREMNPTLPIAVVERAYERDPAAAAAEYGGDFRTDVQAAFAQEVVEAAVEPGCFERSRQSGRQYAGFVDAAGGSGQDSMTMAIAHDEQGIAVLDVIREVKPPFSPKAVVEQFAIAFRGYHIASVKADKWGSEFVVEEFGKHGIRCEQNAEPKSEIYGELLPLLNSGKTRLLHNQRLITQLVCLERRTARGGRETIDHPRGSHDDIANAAAGALVSVCGHRPVVFTPEAVARIASWNGRGPAYSREKYPFVWNGVQH